MKSFRLFKESIIDIPRRAYAPGVFDDEDTDNPKIKDSVLRLITKQFQEFETEYPVIKIALIGSILTKRYRNDADLDINVLFDVPEDKREEERLRLSKQFLASSNPDNIQGKLIPGTRHPVNYYFITDKKTYDEKYQIISKNLNKYSKEFLKKINLKYIVMCENLSISGINTAGIPDHVMKTLIIDLKFNETYFERVIHHELFHIINDGYKELFDESEWKKFNEPNFEYADCSTLHIQNLAH